MTITEIMELGRTYDFEGAYNNGKNPYKFRNGRMQTFNNITKEWIKPSITSAWLNHDFTVTNVTKSEED